MPGSSPRTPPEDLARQPAVLDGQAEVREDRWGDTPVAAVMVRSPRTWPADITIATARAALANPKVHMLLLTRGESLLGTLLRDDVRGEAAQAAPAIGYSSLAGRVVRPQQPVGPIHAAMVEAGTRRLAVVDGDRLVGLLCLKRRLHGFCSDEGIAARRRSRYREDFAPPDLSEP